MTTSDTRAAAPRVRDAAATRTALLQAAMRRFTLLGYDRTTTRDIAADAGANVSLIARYFGSKDGLFAAVLEESTLAMSGGPGSDEPLALVDSIIEGLRTDQWPEFGGQHPLLMLMRESGESDEIIALRRRALALAVDRLSASLENEHRTRPGRGRGAETRLRAETVLALLVGLLSVRDALPEGALAGASPARLGALVGGLIDAVAPVEG